MVAMPLESLESPRHGERNLRLAIVLGLTSAVTVALVFPYIFALMPSLLANLRAASIPPAAMVAAQMAQAGVLISVLAWIGLRLGHPLGLDAPWLRAKVYGGPARLDRSSLKLAVVLGLAASAVMLAVDAVLKPHLPPPLSPPPSEVERWRGFLASFYGGVTEELFCRLFLMSLIAWIAWRIARRPRPAPAGIYWLALVLAALLFGAGHLPVALPIWGPDPVNIVRTILLNSLAGLPLGWLFWRRGLEYAMVAHFTADLVIHVVTRI